MVDMTAGFGGPGKAEDMLAGEDMSTEVSVDTKDDKVDGAAAGEELPKVWSLGD